jgi:hypothetical protein
VSKKEMSGLTLDRMMLTRPSEIAGIEYFRERQTTPRSGCIDKRAEKTHNGQDEKWKEKGLIEK